MPDAGASLAPDVILEESRQEFEHGVRDLADVREWRFSWDRGLFLLSPDRFWVLKLGGRLQADAGVLVPNDGLDGRFGFDGTAVRADVRRARLYVRGTIGDHVGWKIQYDFAVELFEDAYVALRDVGPLDYAHFGHFKEPFSLEELVSSNENVFLERGLPNALITGRNGGAAALSSFFGDRLTTEVGMFGDTSNLEQIGDTFSQTGSGLDVALRVTGLPWREGPHHFLHLGVSYLRRVRDGDMTRFRSPPESNLAPFLADTGDFRTDGSNVVGLEAAYAGGRLYAQGEWILTDPRVVGQDTATFSGLYAFVAWFLTDDHRTFLARQGIWGRVIPRCDVFQTGCWGAWEVAARFSRIDLESGEIRGGILNDTTLGLNWFLTEDLRLSANWVRGHLQTVGTTNILQARFQIAY